MLIILKGIIIGIGKIIPGVSGSMLAISLGIYQKLIDSINNFFKDPKYNLKFLFKFGLGVVIAIIFFSNIVLECLNKFYLITIFFFIGLIIGNIENIKQKIDKKNNYIVVISFIIVTIFGLININNEINITSPLLSALFFALIGLIDALTMVIPGLSGTATLMMIGGYKPLMELFSNLFDFSNIINNISLLIPYIIGLSIGIILTVKLVNYLFNNFKSKTYSGILGFSLSTIVLMGIKCFKSDYSILTLIMGLVILVIGVFITKKINHYISSD